jgi:hypothetical protein
MHIYDILKRPVVTEKTVEGVDLLNKYVFEVGKGCRRNCIRCHCGKCKHLCDASEDGSSWPPSGYP